MLSFTATHSTTSKDIQFNLYGIEFSALYDTYLLFYKINAYQAKQSISNSFYLKLQKGKGFLSKKIRLTLSSCFYYFWIQHNKESVKDLIGRLKSNKYAFLNPHAGIKMVSSQNEYGSKCELSEFLINQLFSSNERSFKWKYSEPFPMHGNKILTKNLARQNSSINYFAILLLQKDL